MRLLSDIWQNPVGVKSEKNVFLIEGNIFFFRQIPLS